MGLGSSAVRPGGQSIQRVRKPSTGAALFLAALLFLLWLGLDIFYQFLDAEGIRFAVTVAGQRISAARRFDQDVRPDQTDLDMNRGDLLHADADFVPTEPRTLAPDHSFVVYFDDCGKEEIAFCPTAGLKCFGGHGRMLLYEPFSADRQSNSVKRGCFWSAPRLLLPELLTVR